MASDVKPRSSPRPRPAAQAPSLRVLICPDKFKGTLTAPEAAAAIARGWHRARPGDTLEPLPISDGGDGFGELLGRPLGAQENRAPIVDAAHRSRRAVWWWEPRSRTALIESARAIGLAMLPPGRFHPFELDTYGLGLLLRAAARRRPRRTLIGLGGSATNDGGFGLARALGWRAVDAAGRRLTRWTELEQLTRLIPPAQPPALGEVIVAVDVRNRLLGPRGCTRVYGPQKGLRPEEFPRAERCLRRLARAVAALQSGQPLLDRQPGAGAAGGLGFGLMAFAGARLEPGFELFARHVNLESRLAAADLVITGEGALDATSLDMGKGVGGVARWCRRAGKPCLALAGVVAARARAARWFAGVHALAPDLTTTDQARLHAARWLAELARRVASGPLPTAGT